MNRVAGRHGNTDRLVADAGKRSVRGLRPRGVSQVKRLVLHPGGAGVRPAARPSNAGVAGTRTSLAGVVEGLSRDEAARVLLQLVDGCPVPVLLTDCSMNLRVMYANEAWRDRGGSAPAPEGRPLREVLQGIAAHGPSLPGSGAIRDSGRGHLPEVPCSGWDTYPLRAAGDRPAHLLIVQRRGTGEPRPGARRVTVERGQGAGAGGAREELSPREREVAELIACGLRNPGIATRLHISRSTVASHVARILQKLGFTNRARIAAWVVQEGLLDAG